jgi:hypothetical protein
MDSALCVRAEGSEVFRSAGDCFLFLLRDAVGGRTLEPRVVLGSRLHVRVRFCLEPCKESIGNRCGGVIHQCRREEVA